MSEKVSKKEADAIVQWFKDMEFDICPWCKKPVEHGQDFGVIYDRDGKPRCIIHATCFDEHTRTIGGDY